MKIYFAGSNTELVAQANESPLVTFAYPKDLVKFKKAGGTKKVFLDSGAFSFFKSGKNISIEQYAKFVYENMESLDVYSNLDVIGSAEGTMKNQKALESMGLSPLPVFHYGEPFSHLESLANKYPYIAIGGIVPIALQPKKIRAFLDNVFFILKKHWPIKTHGFGVNNFSLWERYPFYSVDATSWMQNGLFGTSKFEKDKRLQTIKKSVIPYKERMFGDLQLFSKKAREVTELWAKRGITW